jgi:hypothetical protein
VKQFLDYYRCPEEYAALAAEGSSDGASGYFRFGPDVVCFGRPDSSHCSAEFSAKLKDVAEEIRMGGGVCRLPFKLEEVVENLRRERYVNGIPKDAFTRGMLHAIQGAYSFFRPLMPFGLRKQIHRMYFRHWEAIPFPNWPVDRTVDKIFERLLACLLQTSQASAIPFIWFWPDGLSSGAIMTHDVEAARGLEFCSQLMDLDDRWGIKSSFQIVPEGRYEVTRSLLESIRARGFEVNVHDLNHDGELFKERKEFLRRADRINHYVKEYGARGFRSGVLYRKQDWYDAFEFSYDMSCPSVGHLEAQRGGCCTVMPFFIGKILELPLTTSQDYSLFHILDDYSVDLWRRQIRSILEGNGLVSCIVHPDYIIEKRARQAYQGLLEHLTQLRSEGRIWMALPSEVDLWWRERSRMKLVRAGDSWRIEGPGSQRAKIAWASIEGQRLVYRIEQNAGVQALAGPGQQPKAVAAEQPRPISVETPR